MKYFFSILFLYFIPAPLTAKVYDEKNNWQCVIHTSRNIVYAGGKNILQYFENSSSHVISLPVEMHISALYEYDNQLLIGTKNGDLYKYSTLHNSLNLIVNVKAEISKIKMLDNEIFITTLGRGYGVLANNAIRFYNTGNFLNDNYIYNVVSDKLYGIWGCSDNGTFCSKDSLLANSLNKKLNDKIVTAIEIKNKKAYCGTQKGDLTEMNLTDTNLLFHYNKSYWGGATINDIIVLDSKIMIATDMGAFAVYKGEQQKTDTLILNKKIRDLELDCSGAVWVCGENILARYYTEYFSLIANSKKFVHSMIGDGDKYIWFTPDIGLSKYNIETNAVENIKQAETSANTDITCFYKDKNKNLWFGTSGDGIFLYNISDKSIQKINIDNSIETAQILSITGNDDKLWVATLNGVWYIDLHDNSNRFYSLEEKLNLKKYYVFNIFHDKNENLWLATDGQGILKLKNNSIEYFSKKHKIESKVFYSVIQDGNGSMWFNAYLNGLYCVNNDSVFHLTKDNGLQSNNVQAIYNMNAQTIIAVSPTGIDVINNQKKSVLQIPFSISNFQCVPELNSVTNIGNTIFIGTDTGIIKFQFPSYFCCSSASSFIASIEVMDLPVEPLVHNFKHTDNYIKFNIATGNTFEEKIYLRYKLEGLNDLWVNTLNNDIVFPRLNSGSYTFKLQSANNIHFENASEESYTFTIDKPFWEKWWFISLLILTSILAVYQYIKYRENKASRLQLLEKDKAIAEFETLKAQINPHFLFNSFNTLIQVIDENKEMAIEYTQHLSDFYRSLIAFKERDLVTLEEDLEILNNYFYLQKMRFGNSLNFNQKIPVTEQKNISIPPLTLQMLAENAIKHNTISDNKKLEITIYIDGDYVVFENNLQKKISVEKGEKLGLQNIKNRYRQYSDSEIVILTSDSSFIVKLPKLYT